MSKGSSRIVTAISGRATESLTYGPEFQIISADSGNPTLDLLAEALEKANPKVNFWAKWLAHSISFSR